MGASTFISYSNHDRAVAESLCAALEASGTQCWIAPRDISPSAEWAEEIIDGINHARVMLLVFSSHSNGSPQVRREIERAIHKEIPVIPFRIENIAPTRSMEYFLSSQHWFDAYHEPVTAYLPRLCQLIAKLCLAAGEAPSVTAAGNGQPFSGNPYLAPAPAIPAAPAVPSESVAPAGHALSSASGSPAATSPATADAAPPLPGFAEAELKLLETRLATHIGPIARLLVRKAASRATTPQSLIDALANELDLPVERTAFLDACRQQFGR